MDHLDAILKSCVEKINTEVCAEKQELLDEMFEMAKDNEVQAKRIRELEAQLKASEAARKVLEDIVERNTKQ